MATSPAPEPTPFDRIGGDDGVRRLVERFYDLMEESPRYVTLRAMHQPDLAATRESLAGFLTGWLGGAQHWFTTRSGPCIMSLHRGLGVTPGTAGEWLHAMSRALGDVDVEPALAARMRGAFARMAAAMIVAD